MDKKELENTIRERKQLIGEKEQAKAVLFTELGQGYMDLPKKTLREKAVKELLTAGDELDKGIAYYDNLKDAIANKQKEIESADDDMAGVKAEIEDIKGRLREKYNPLAHELHTLIMGQDALQEYREHYQQVDSLEAERAELEKKLAELQEEKGNIFKKVKNRFSIMITRNNLNSKTYELEKAFSQAGSTLIQSDIWAKVTDPAIKESKDLVLSSNDRLNALDAKEKSLIQSKDRLLEELNKLTANNQPDVRVKEVEEEIAKKQQEKAEIIKALGEILYTKQLEEKIEDKTLSALFGKLETCDTAIADAGKDIDKATAALEYLKRKKALNEHLGQKEKLEKIIGEKQGELEQLSAQIKDLEITVDELKKRAKEFIA